MKKGWIFLMLFIIVAACVCCFFAGRIETRDLYPMTGVITDISDDVVTFEDFNGFRWVFNGAEDYFIGDVVAVIMDGRNTPLIFDDTIVDIRYDGWIEGYFSHFLQ